MSNDMIMAGDDLLLVIDELCPGLEAGRDYMCARHIGPDGVQENHAYIWQWTNKLYPEPTQADLEAHWSKNASAVLGRGLEKALRFERESRLEKADNLVNHAHDSGDEAYFTAAKAYRQALRDVPQQSGWPDSIIWPEIPTQSE